MNNFMALTKAFFLNGFKVNKKKGNQKSSFKKMILLFLGIILFSLYYNYIFYDGYIELNIPLSGYLLSFIGIAILLTLILSITGIESTIYKTKDYEFLKSLPVSEKTIVLSKIASQYLINFFEDFGILLPTIIFYYYGTHDLYVTILSFIFLFFVPLISLILGSLIASIIVLLTNRLKHGNVVKIILYLIYFVLVFILSFSFSGTSTIDSTKVLKLLPFLKLLEKAFDYHYFYWFIILITLVLAFTFMIIIFISLIYTPINNYLMNVKFHSDYIVMNKNENFDYRKILIKKEFKFIINNPLYLINSYMGPLLYLVLGVMMNIIVYNEVDDLETIIEAKTILPLIIVSFGLMMNMFTSSTSSTISLEAKNFENLLALPIKTMEIIKSKIAVGITIPFILNLISGIIVGTMSVFIMNIDAYIYFMMIILPILGSILMALIGMISNLKYPKLEFDNFDQVFKNSSSVLYSVIFGFLISIVNMFLFIILRLVLNSKLFFIPFLLPIFILTSLIVICYKYLMKNGDKLFRDVLNK